MPDHKKSPELGDLVTHEPELTLGELCKTCDLSEQHIVSYVAEGIIEPQGASPTRWRFSRTHLIEVRRANRLERDLRLNAAGVALALELWDQIDELERRLTLLENNT